MNYSAKCNYDEYLSSVVREKELLVNPFLGTNSQSLKPKLVKIGLFNRDIADEESWIKEKKLLVGSDDYGRDLTGVQNLKKKHKRLESELASHEPTIQVI